MRKGAGLVIATVAAGLAIWAPSVGAAAPPTCNQVQGTAGPDVFVGGSESNSYNGLAGDDRINAGSGDDNICGGEGHDYVQLGSGSDVFNNVGGGNDTIDGGSGADVIIAAGGGTVTIMAGSDNDAIAVNDGQGGDKVDCGGGFDSVNADFTDLVSPTNCENVNLL